MSDINEIMKMLDCNNSLEVQQKGIELARNVRCIRAFVKPRDSVYGLNVWKNCAIIISERSDKELRRYFIELMTWLAELLWEAAGIIIERLLKYEDVKELSHDLEKRVNVAKALENDQWLAALARFLDSPRVAAELSEVTLKELRRVRVEG